MFFIFIFSVLLQYSHSFVSTPTTGTTAAPGYEWWDQWLKKNVSGKGEVNYKNMKPELAALQSFMAEMSRNVPASGAPKNEQMAYWINLYNAATIQLILQHYPVKSIRDISNGKPWDDVFVTAGTKKYSLNIIENDILRKQFADPRIHFAINCAAKSCPRLMNGAFDKDRLEMQLNSLAKSFINDASKNKITPTQIDISEIFNWYAKDFTQQGSLIGYLNKWSAVSIAPSASIHYLNYDWSLNELP
ncbi:MAG: DUF547 domain-containing protein [Chitinophagales bacterium]|nr:DUF547 domain-containing protein [Chitinophagales bacterium]